QMQLAANGRYPQVPRDRIHHQSLDVTAELHHLQIASAEVSGVDIEIELAGDGSARQPPRELLQPDLPRGAVQLDEVAVARGPHDDLAGKRALRNGRTHVGRVLRRRRS